MVKAGEYQLAEVSDADKAAVRTRLPLLLAEPDPRVRSAVAAALGTDWYFIANFTAFLQAYCTGEVGSKDWPEAWPDFLDRLRACVAAPLAGAGKS